MLTTSKKWAVVAGFVIVVAALTLAASRPGLREGLPFFAGRAAEPSHSAATDAVIPATKEPVKSAFAPLQAATGAKPPTPETPRFDVVRVEPNGEIVLAGRGAPDVTVVLLGDGRVMGEARTDAGGHFAMLPPALEAGDHALTLRQAVDGVLPVASNQSVAVSVPDRGRGPVVVALSEPGAATKLLSPLPASIVGQPETAGPKASVQPAAPVDQPLVVRSVELENGSGFYATGVAAPGTKLRVYLNDRHLTDVAAAANGNWSVKLRKGLTGGHYVVRADGSIDGTTVTARAEVPFDVPAAMSDAAPGARTPQDAASTAEMAPAGLRRSPARIVPDGTMQRQSLPPPSMPALSAQPPSLREVAAAAPGVADAVIDEISTATVRTGDNLWDISRVRLGQGRRYTRIFAANAAQIRDPHLIYPGQVFVLPGSGE